MRAKQMPVLEVDVHFDDIHHQQLCDLPGLQRAALLPLPHLRKVSQQQPFANLWRGGAGCGSSARVELWGTGCRTTLGLPDVCHAGWLLQVVVDGEIAGRAAVDGPARVAH